MATLARARALGARLMATDPHYFLMANEPERRPMTGALHRLLHGHVARPEERAVGRLPVDDWPRQGLGLNFYQALVYTPYTPDLDPCPVAYRVHYRREGCYVGTVADDADGLFYVDDPDDLDAGIEVRFGGVSFAAALQMALALAFLRRAHHFADADAYAAAAARAGTPAIPGTPGRRAPAPGTRLALTA